MVGGRVGGSICVPMAYLGLGLGLGLESGLGLCSRGYGYACVGQGLESGLGLRLGWLIWAISVGISQVL